MTIVGDAGVGKSRLVAEALAALDARVVRGRCLPYGEGITYWPVVEVVKQLEALPSEPVGGGRDPLAPGRVRRRRRAGTRSPGPSASCSRSRRRSSSSSTTSSGARRRSSTSSSRRRCSRPARRSCFCAWRAPSCVERRPSWPGALRLEPLARGRGRRADRRRGLRRAARADRPRRRRQPALHLRDARDGAPRTATSRCRRR